MDALILAGGKGTRLHSVVKDRPKVMAEVNGRPYLTYLFDQLVSSGIDRVILCIGYMADYIQDYFGDTYRQLSLIYSRETNLLGTSGAIRQALPYVQSDTILIMNGDSYCDVSLKHFIESHHSGASLVLVQQSNTARYGRVNFDEDSYVTDFIEKDGQQVSGWINAGVYLFNRVLIESLPIDTEFSLEKDVFPQWVNKRKLRGFFCQGRFIDIGLPRSYAVAGDFFSSQEHLIKRYVALDRDGTIIKQIPYLSDPEQIELLTGAVDGIQKMRSLGLGVVIVTNQSAIGRGYFDEQRLAELHSRMNALLAYENLAIDGIYYCPATPQDNSPDRKPNPGMMKAASRDFRFSLSDSFVIGDKLSDVELARNVAAVGILVRTGYGAEIDPTMLKDDEYIVDNLYDASQLIKKLLVRTN